MDDYIGFRQEEVKSALAGQGFQPLFSPEPSNEYPEGVIIRTDPASGTPLEEGQSIKIYVSSGPDIVKAEMLSVVGKDKDHAVELLNAKGFKSVRTITVPNDAPVGQVVSQSEKAGEQIDVTTEIFLEISEGPMETEPPTEAPEEVPVVPQETAAPMGKATISFALPERGSSYIAQIHRDGQFYMEIPIDPGVQLLNVPVEGSGSVMFALVIDGAVYSSQVVNF